MEKLIASSNEERAIKALYQILSRVYHLSEEDLSIEIGHTSCLYLRKEIPDKLRELLIYCDGFTDGFADGYNEGYYAGE